MGSSSVSSAVLLVANLFHPLNVLPVNLLLNGYMRHTIGGGRAMPVFHARRCPYDITRLDLLLFTTLLLHPACAGSHDQGLAERMRVPCRASAGLERDAERACGIARLEQGINPYTASEILGGTVRADGPDRPVNEGVPGSLLQGRTFLRSPPIPSASVRSVCGGP
jgi:hypothetical protein